MPQTGPTKNRTLAAPRQTHAAGPQVRDRNQVAPEELLTCLKAGTPYVKQSLCARRQWLAPSHKEEEWRMFRK
jgi:hypothetical protein